VARRNILFDGNSAEDDGGGIYISESKLELTDGVFVRSNHAADEGGGFFLDEGTVVMRRNCTIALNPPGTVARRFLELFPRWN
jgi:predicted outer membrane repeat protein